MERRQDVLVRRESWFAVVVIESVVASAVVLGCTADNGAAIAKSTVPGNDF
jgi:hypothetical protein